MDGSKAQTLRDLSRRWFEEVWNESREATLLELLHDDCLAYGFTTSNAPPLGKAEVHAWWRQMANAFPDVQVDVHSIVVEGDSSAVRFDWYGTHLGDLDGLPATGRRVRITGMIFARWQDGQIIEGWNNFDHLGLLRQLGLA